MEWCKIFSSLVLLLILNGDMTSAQSKCPRLTIVNGRVRTRNRGHMAAFICNDGFHRVGPRFSVCLSTGLWTQRTPMCVGIGCRPVQGIPNLKIESQYSGAVLKFSCNPGFYRNGPEQAFCDGSAWSSEAPICMEGVSLGCDFETEGMCGWSQDEKDDFDWTWHKGHTPTSDTGPSVDHTTNSTDGHYLYIESSAPTKKDFKARLVSPIYKATDLTAHCLQFFYHMQGPEEPGEMGHLEVYIHPTSIPTNVLYPSNLIFSAKNNMGDKWQKADLEIPPQTEPVKIIFQGTRLKSWNSDIALDDVKIYSCPEGPDSLADTMESSTSKTETTTTTPPPATTITTSPSPSTAVPDAGDETSSTGNATPVDGGGDHNASTSGSAVNETTATSLPGNASSENTTNVTDQSTDGTTSGEGGENSTDLTFRPSHEGGGSQGEESSTDTAGTVNTGNKPGVRQVRNQQPRTAATASTSSEILPIVIGILAALVIVAVFVAVVVWAVARRKQKRDAELEDELKIISKSSESK